jgi:hypothetical protein
MSNSTRVHKILAHPPFKLNAYDTTDPWLFWNDREENSPSDSDFKVTPGYANHHLEQH